MGAGRRSPEDPRRSRKPRSRRDRHRAVRIRQQHRALLHHIALIEADWLYADILLVDHPQWVLEAFPDGDRDAEGRLVPYRKPLAAHLATMALVREELVAALRNQSEEEFARVRHSGSGDLTPQWVLHHLRQHEAEHRGQIQALITALRSFPSSLRKSPRD